MRNDPLVSRDRSGEVEVYGRRDRDGVVNAVGELSARILTSVGNKTYYTQLRLGPLSKKGADEMLTALLGTATI